MPIALKRRPRKRIGRVSDYYDRGQEWLYSRDNGDIVRRPAGARGHVAEAIASLINANLPTAAAGIDVFALINQHLP